MQKIQGWSEKGNTLVVTSGLNSVTKVQVSFPLSTITVYRTGTTTLASIYSDNNSNPTPLANPFTVNSNGSFGFYAPNGRYDIVFSGTGIVSPFTLSDFWLFDESSLVIDVTASPYLADNTGSSDSSSAFNAAFTAATALGGATVFAPSGTYKFLSNVTPGANTSIRGAGMGATIISIVASSVANLRGFSFGAANLSIQDMTINMTVSTGVTVRAIQFDAAVQNVIIERVEFNGIGGSLGATSAAFALTWNGGNVTGLRVSNCRFNNVAWAAIMDNSDTAVTKNVVFDRCTVVNSKEGFNINHPSVTGSFTDVAVTNCYFDTMAEWSIGASGRGVKRVTISNNTFTNHLIENIHIEDLATDITVSNSHFVAGTTSGAHGMVHVIANSTGLVISGNTFDLTANATGTIAATMVQGGGSGAPTDVAFTNNIVRVKAGVFGLRAQAITGLVISNNVFKNPDTASKAAYFIDLSGDSSATGSNNSFYNPGPLVNIDDNSQGVLSLSRIDGELTSFAFLTGNTNGSTSIVFDGFTITRAYVADNATDNVLFPAGTLFDGVIGMRFIQNATATTWVATSKVSWDNTTFSMIDTFQYSGASSAALLNVNKVGANITSRSFKAASATGAVAITFNGVYIP